MNYINHDKVDIEMSIKHYNIYKSLDKSIFKKNFFYNFFSTYIKKSQNLSDKHYQYDN